MASKRQDKMADKNIYIYFWALLILIISIGSLFYFKILPVDYDIKHQQNCMDLGYDQQIIKDEYNQTRYYCINYSRIEENFLNADIYIEKDGTLKKLWG